MFDTLATKTVEPVRWLIVLGIAYTLATSVWSFFDSPTVTAPTPAQTIDRAPATAKPAANLNWILAKHLFGEAGAKPVAQASDAPAVQTRLPLELQSVFVADVASESRAIVAQRGKAGERYSVGDKLPGSAELIEVLSDRIILRRAGNRETLMFPEWKNEFATVEGAPARPAAQPRAQRSQPQRATPSRPVRQGAAQAEDTDPAEVVADYRERLSEDAAGTLAELGIESADGGGYKIGNLAQSPYLRQTGLQSGDVILSVNGRPVGDIQQDQLELENILAQGSARIEIKRGNRRFFITASLP